MCYRMLANVKQPPNRRVFIVSAFHLLDLGISLQLGVCEVAPLGEDRREEAVQVLLNPLQD